MPPLPVPPDLAPRLAHLFFLSPPLLIAASHMAPCAFALVSFACTGRVGAGELQYVRLCLDCLHAHAEREERLLHTSATSRRKVDLIVSSDPLAPPVTDFDVTVSVWFPDDDDGDAAFLQRVSVEHDARGPK